jgi:tetratricopeptide (TPR) repeat protein
MKMSTLKKKSDQSGSNHEDHINYSTDGENPATKSNLSKHASNSVLNLEHLDLANEVLFPEPAPLPNMSGRVKIEKAFAQGFLSYQRHQYLEASQQLQRALKGRHRGSFLAHFLQGLCNYSLGQFKLAHADFSVCCLVADSQARTKCEGSLAFYNRGLVHIKLNEIRKAADDISTAIEIFPEEMMFHSCRALLCRRLGRFEEAQNEYLTLRRLEAKVEKLNDGDKADNLKRQETIFVSSSLKKFSSSNISTSRSFHSANSTDLKAKLYGDLHQALTCRPGKRTKQQIDLLTEESRMMAAFSHFDTQQLSTLWQYFEYKNYPSNARIFEQGDEADDYFLVWSGSGKSLYIAPARIDVKQRCLQSLIQMTFS